MELYLAQVQKAESIQERAGIATESEDIRTRVIPVAEALRMVENGRIEDAKTIIALLILKQRLD